MSLPTPALLLAEDDKDMRSLLVDVLKAAGYAVTACADGAEAAARLGLLRQGERRVRFDVIVSDIRLPHCSALDLLERMPPERRPPAVLITAFGDGSIHERARKAGAVACLDKPFDMDELVRIVRSALPAGEKEVGDDARLQSDRPAH